MVVLDERFIYNYVMYCLGIIISKKTSLFNKLSNYKWLICCVFIYITFAIILYYRYMTPLLNVLSFIGVWMLLSISFCMEKFTSNHTFKRVVEYISYASMSLYLFHRLFYYIAMKVVEFDSVLLSFSYLFLIAFPIGLFMSYEIQQFYDKSFKNMQSFKL